MFKEPLASITLAAGVGCGEGKRSWSRRGEEMRKLCGEELEFKAGSGVATRSAAIVRDGNEDCD